MHGLLQTSAIKVQGQVSADAREFRADAVELQMANSKVQVQGKVDFETGYDLRGSGKVDLKDIGTLSEQPILGHGNLAVQVVGPAKNVLIHFDVDAQETEYLHLALGALKGRITWDDGTNQVLFPGAELSKGRTRYLGKGQIDAGDIEKIDLDFQVTGDIEDLIQVFEYKRKTSVGFRTRSQVGIKGPITVRGGLDLASLKVLTSLQGWDWDYWGERLSTVSAAGGFDGGRYFIDRFESLKNRGKLFGSISHSPDGSIEWKLRSEALSLNDVDLIARLDVPIRGQLAVQSRE